MICVYMYYILNWFISSIFLFSTLVPLCRRQGSLCEPFCLDLALEHFVVVCPNFSISSTRWCRPCFSSGSLPCRRRERAPYSRTSQPAWTSSYPSLPQLINTPVWTIKFCSLIRTPVLLSPSCLLSLHSSPSRFTTHADVSCRTGHP
jgi:hypothetical protein